MKGDIDCPISGTLSVEEGLGGVTANGLTGLGSSTGPEYPEA